ncbi:MAG TPA: thrombospondin type 3 repeat-containing protein, partial [bacterium]|nr:thrombospondin type 3 repeat-containing protein [bacterium]
MNKKSLFRSRVVVLTRLWGIIFFLLVSNVVSAAEALFPWDYSGISYFIDPLPFQDVAGNQHAILRGMNGGITLYQNMDAVPLNPFQDYAVGSSAAFASYNNNCGPVATFNVMRYYGITRGPGNVDMSNDSTAASILYAMLDTNSSSCNGLTGPFPGTHPYKIVDFLSATMIGYDVYRKVPLPFSAYSPNREKEMEVFNTIALPLSRGNPVMALITPIGGGLHWVSITGFDTNAYSSLSGSNTRVILGNNDEMAWDEFVSALQFLYDDAWFLFAPILDACGISPFTFIYAIRPEDDHWDLTISDISIDLPESESDRYTDPINMIPLSYYRDVCSDNFRTSYPNKKHKYLSFTYEKRTALKAWLTCYFNGVEMESGSVFTEGYNFSTPEPLPCEAQKIHANLNANLFTGKNYLRCAWLERDKFTTPYSLVWSGDCNLAPPFLVRDKTFGVRFLLHTSDNDYLPSDIGDEYVAEYRPAMLVKRWLLDSSANCPADGDGDHWFAKYLCTETDTQPCDCDDERLTCRDSDEDGFCDTLAYSNGCSPYDIDWHEPIDNCPGIPNADQADSDLDNVGDVCEDEDSDGVYDITDNCLGVYNPMVPISGEVAFGNLGLDNTANGAFLNPVTRLYTKTVYSPANFFTVPTYYWQPDHDLDGDGDACDLDTAYVTPLEVNSSMHISVSGSNKLYTMNDYLTLKVQATTNTTTNKIVPSTNRYCWVTKQEYNTKPSLWGTPGYCSTYAPPALGWPLNRLTAFGYSHGSEIEPVRLNKTVWNEISWSSDSGRVLTANRETYHDEENDAYDLSFFPNLIGNLKIPLSYPFQNLSVNLTSPITPLHWNWKTDVVTDKPEYSGNVFSGSEPIMGHPVSPPLANNDFFFAFSSGARDVNSALNYLNDVSCASADNCNNKVNSLYFRINPSAYPNYELKQFARSIRMMSEPMGISYLQFMTGPLGSDWVLDFWKRHHVRLPDFSLDPKLGSYAVRRWEMDSSIVVSLPKYHDERMVILIPGEEGFTYGIRPDDDPNTPATFHIVVNYPSDPADWRPIGFFELSHADYEILAAAQHNGDFYALLKEAGDIRLVKASLANSETAEWQVEMLALAPAELTDPTIHWIGDMLHILGITEDGMGLHRFENGAFVPANSTLLPPTRDFYNAYDSGDALYLAGGKKNNLTTGIPTYLKDIWRYTAAAGWVKLADNLNTELLKTLIRVDGDTLFLANQMIASGNMTQRVIVDLAAPIGSNTSYDMVEVHGLTPEEVPYYCLNEMDTILKGGTLVDGFCQPFSHPWYKSFSIGTTVYSVAGKSDRLYVGTNSTIRVYDISNPNAMVLKSTFTTNRRVYDLEVAEGDIMYAATSGGI